MEDIPKNRHRFIIEILIFSTIVFLGIMWVAPGPAFPLIMADYGISRVSVSWANSIVSLIVATFAIPAGILASRIGLRKTFTIGTFLVPTGTLILFSSNITQLLAIRILFALGASMTFPIAGGLIMEWFKGKELPIVNGLNIGAASTGNTIAMFLTVPLAVAFGWREAFAIYGAAAFVVAFAWLIRGKPPAAESTEIRTEVLPPLINLGTVFKKRSTLLLGLGVAGPTMAMIGLISWLPTYYHEVFGMSLSRGSSITGLATLFAIPASIFGGIISMKIGRRKPLLVIPGFLMGIAALGTFLFNEPIVIQISIAVMGACSMIFRGPLFTMAMELPGMNPRIVAVTLATTIAMGNIAGFLGPLTIGALTDALGTYLPGLLVSSAASWSLLAAGLLLPETGPKARRRGLAT